MVQLVTIIRPGNRIVIPGVDVQMGRPAAAGGGGDWWDYTGVVAAYDAKNASSLANSYVNLANPGTYDCTPGVAPTWANGTGWTFNGSTMYLDTGILTGGTSTNLAWSCAVRWNSQTRRTRQYLFGIQGTDGTSYGFKINPRDGVSPGTVLFYNARVGVSTSNPATSNVACIAGTNGYLNGVLEVSGLGTRNIPNDTIYIGAENDGGVMDNPTDGVIVAIAFYNTVLSAATYQHYPPQWRHFSKKDLT